jgi:hypothetical protein
MHSNNANKNNFFCYILIYVLHLSPCRCVTNKTALLVLKFPDCIDHSLDKISLGLQNIFETHIRRGGSSRMVNHSEWFETIDSEPDIISMHLLPLTSLLGGISGIGYLTHAINLYLRCK